MLRSTFGLILSLALAAPLAAAFAQARDTVREWRVEISITARRLVVVDTTGDTTYTAPVAVGSGRTLETADRTWKFRTPVGVTKVVAKETDPVWVPPDWHYVEVAREHGLQLDRLNPGAMVVLSSDRLLVVSGKDIGLVGDDGLFVPLPPDEEIVFDGTLFIPPFGTAQRRVAGVLGPYRLLLGNGIGLHGTPDQASIGKAVTHGCIRLKDADITWLYESIPIGTKVVITP